LGYNSSISIQSFIFISLVLLTSITSVPAIQSQSPIQTQTQPSTTVASQIVKESQRRATANPGPYATFVEQILTELTRQSGQVSNQGNVLDEIYSQVSAYPYGIVSQSLARFARALSTDI
jgi:polysaccharide pyruvyl transferase WcaK-like protein